MWNIFLSDSDPVQHLPDTQPWHKYWVEGLVRGLCFGSKTIFILTPLLKIIFFPPLATRFSTPIVAFFSLILPYFAFTLTFYFPFSHFLSPFLLFIFPFFLFLLHFPPFFSSPFHIFSLKWSLADIFSSPPGWGGIFQYIDPWVW